MSQVFSLTVKHGKSTYKLEDFVGSSTIGELKAALHKRTNVNPANQKLMGLRGKYTDESTLESLKVKPKQKLQLLGTPDTQQFVYDAEKEEEFDDDVLLNKEVSLALCEETQVKLQRRIDSYKVEELHPGREGKKLLVLDIDYTLYDHRSPAERLVALRRPYLHSFLAAAYENYDIVIWSATSMKWVHLKMKELNVLNDPRFKIRFLLDEKAMFTVEAESRSGKGKKVRRVKPLALIWALYPQYSAANTIMFDDVSGNFLCNVQSGLKIRPFRNGPLNQETDEELLHLGGYLRLISSLDSLEELDHSRWSKYLSVQRQELPEQFQQDWKRFNE